MDNPHTQPALASYWQQGFRNGQSIASENVHIGNSELAQAVREHCEHDAKSLLATLATLAESEHFRQFAPFEELARELNSWEGGDAWDAYESGVQAGIAHELALPFHAQVIAELQQRIDNLAS